MTLRIGDVERNELGGRKVLVTGGAGFVGSQLVPRLVATGAQVKVLDDLFTGRADAVPEGVPLVEGSVSDGALVEELVAEADYVFHLAARNILVSVDYPEKDYATNIDGTMKVLLAARKHPVRRVLYTSSASVYGNPRHAFCHEEDPVYCLSPYAASKLAGESYCSAFYESYQVAVTMVRYSNVYGPGQDSRNPYCGVISRFLRAAERGEPLKIHGDGLQTRDYTFVEDTVEATVLAAISPHTVGEIYNIGTGIETSVVQLAAYVQELFGESVTIENIDVRDIDNLRRRVMSIERIRKAMRWVPRFTLQAGLARTLTWFREHPEALLG